jgi:hypothetical protein
MNCDFCRLQQFSLGIVSNNRKGIAGRFFSWATKGQDCTKKITLWSYLCCLLLPSIMAFMALYIFLFGVSMGPVAAKQWLIGEIASVVMDAFLLLPMRVCAKSIMLASVVSVDIQELYELVATRAKLVMLRRSGMMKYAASLVQHFNPACRAARKFPELDISRLLMSFNDNDFPSQLVQDRPRSNFLLAGLNIIFLTIIVAFGLCNEVLQDIILGISVSIGVNGLALGLTASNALQQAFPAFVVAGLALIYIIVSYIDRTAYNRKNIGVYSVTSLTNEQDQDNVLDCMVDLEMRAKPNFHDRWKLKAKAATTARAARMKRSKLAQVMIDVKPPVDDARTDDADEDNRGTGHSSLHRSESEEEVQVIVVKRSASDEEMDAFPAELHFFESMKMNPVDPNFTPLPINTTYYSGGGLVPTGSMSSLPTSAQFSRNHQYLYNTSQRTNPIVGLESERGAAYRIDLAASFYADAAAGAGNSQEPKPLGTYVFGNKHPSSHLAIEQSLKIKPTSKGVNNSAAAATADVTALDFSSVGIVGKPGITSMKKIKKYASSSRNAVISAAAVAVNAGGARDSPPHPSSSSAAVAPDLTVSVRGARAHSPTNNVAVREPNSFYDASHSPPSHPHHYRSDRNSPPGSSRYGVAHDSIRDLSRTRKVRREDSTPTFNIGQVLPSYDSSAEINELFGLSPGKEGKPGGYDDSYLTKLFGLESSASEKDEMA